MHIIGYRPQRTLARAVEVAGTGLVTGREVRVRFVPAAANSGIVFVRRDRSGLTIPAQVGWVRQTQRRTTLGTPPDAITLVEHVLAALSGLRIDNCQVELDGPEPPGLDGSAAGYVAALQQAGTVLQGAMRPIWAVHKPLRVVSAGSSLTLYPPDSGEPGLRISYHLDYGPYGPIPPQRVSRTLTPQVFQNELAACRTFVTLAEAEELQRQGVGRHLGPEGLLVFGPQGLLHNRLRFADEPARHKVLDLIGDLALWGADLAGHVVAYRSGHSLNVELVRRLAAAARQPAAAPWTQAA